VNDGFGEASGIVFDADGFAGFVEVELANAVDLAEIGDGEDCCFGRRHAVTVENIKLCHIAMIAAAFRMRR